MDLQKLREQTRVEHEATESLLPLMSETLTRQAYGTELRKLYNVICAWDLWAVGRAPERFRPLIEVRQRSGLLKQDLVFLGLEPQGVPVPAASFEAILFEEAHNQSTEAGNESTPQLRAREQARFGGMLYVVEGSTLGGQYIARHVEGVLGLAGGEGYAYFQGYSEQTGARWREVRSALGDLPEEMLGECVGAAKRTFALFAAALREDGTSEEQKQEPSAPQ